MKIVGFNFNKMSVDKNSGEFKGAKINNSVDIISINSVKSSMISQKEELIAVNFKYNVEFGDKIANIHLEGSVLLALESKEAKKITDGWKNKNLENEFKIPILNLIIRKSDIKALELGDDFNLPPHIQLRSLKAE